MCRYTSDKTSARLVTREGLENVGKRFTHQPRLRSKLHQALLEPYGRLPAVFRVMMVIADAREGDELRECVNDRVG